VEDFLAGEEMDSLPNLRFWAGALKMIRIVERPIEASSWRPHRGMDYRLFGKLFGHHI